MNYKKKRTKSGLSTFTIAKELGIPEEKYKLVEQGKLNLEKDLLDKFLDIVRRSKEINFNKEAKIIEINEWLRNGQAEKDIKKSGYNKSELSEKLGFNFGYVSHLLKNPDKSVSNDFKEKLYDFVQNPLNKKIFDEEIKKKKIAISEVDKWIDSGKAKEDIKNCGVISSEISKMLGHEENYVSNLLRKSIIGKYQEPKKKLYDFVQKLISTSKENVEEEKEKPIKMEKSFEEIEKIKRLEFLEQQLNDLLKENQFLKDSLRRLFKI